LIRGSETITRFPDINRHSAVAGGIMVGTVRVSACDQSSQTPYAEARRGFDPRASAAGTLQSSLQGRIHGVPRIESAGAKDPN
jgi:hypothetical protein